MSDTPPLERTVELLQQLGLKEYEAKAFAALSRLEKGTAKDVSDISDVPRTRVYDAIRVLESKGLVAVQHSNPQVFRAVETDEAVETLRTEYEQRVQSLKSQLGELEPAQAEGKADVAQEIWTLSGSVGIGTRAQRLIENAESEIILAIEHEDTLTESMINDLRSASARGIDLLVGTPSAEVCETVQELFPDAAVFVSGLEWLHGVDGRQDSTEIGLLLLVDREALLVSTASVTGADSPHHEQAVFGRGFDNGLVTIVRRLLTAELPETEESDGGDA